METSNLKTRPTESGILSVSAYPLHQRRPVPPLRFLPHILSPCLQYMPAFYAIPISISPSVRPFATRSATQIGSNYCRRRVTFPPTGCIHLHTSLGRLGSRSQRGVGPIVRSAQSAPRYRQDETEFLQRFPPTSVCCYGLALLVPSLRYKHPPSSASAA